MKVKDYGDMLSQVKGKPCIGFVMFGEYQGEWVALLDSGDKVELWKGYYGSCSGCDFIEDKRDYLNNEIDDRDAIDYFKEERPFLEIDKSLIINMTLKQFKEILPVNVKSYFNEFDDYSDDKLYKILKESIKQAN